LNINTLKGNFLLLLIAILQKDKEIT